MTTRRQTGLRVLLVGATGLIGGHCLSKLLADDEIGSVTVFAVRAASGRDSTRSAAAALNASRLRPVAVHHAGLTCPICVCTRIDLGLSTFDT